jgi:hypothetical protein
MPGENQILSLMSDLLGRFEEITASQATMLSEMSQMRIMLQSRVDKQDDVNACFDERLSRLETEVATISRKLTA